MYDARGAVKRAIGKTRLSGGELAFEERSFHGLTGVPFSTSLAWIERTSVAADRDQREVNVRETTVSIGRLSAWTSLRGSHWSMPPEKPVKGCFLRLAATAPVGPFNSHDKAEITVPVKETTVETGTVIVTRIK